MLAEATKPKLSDAARIRRKEIGVADWLLRLTFVLCGAIVIFMAVHGDEHGRRPRFVWKSHEETIKVSILQSHDALDRQAADTGKPILALEMASAPALHAVGSRARAAVPNSTARRIAYLTPLPNGPPARG